MPKRQSIIKKASVVAGANKTSVEGSERHSAICVNFTQINHHHCVFKCQDAASDFSCKNNAAFCMQNRQCVGNAMAHTGSARERRADFQSDSTATMRLK
jgi:hypothetical protein